MVTTLRHAFAWSNGVKASLTINKLDDASFLDTIDRLELAEVVQDTSVDLETETRAVTRFLLVHEHLMNLLYKLHGRDLEIEWLETWHLDLDNKRIILNENELVVVIVAFASFLSC